MKVKDYRSTAEAEGYRVVEVRRGYEVGYAWAGPFEEGEAYDGQPGGSMLTTEAEAWRACCEENELV